MKRLLHFYRGLLRLYPPEHRAEMGAEMLATFEDLLEAAGPIGWQAAVCLCWREVCDLPQMLLRAYWDQIHKPSKELQMAGNELLASSKQEPPTLSSGNQPAPWRKSILAGLPHALLVLVLLVIPLVSRVQSDGTLGSIVEIASVVLAWGMVAVFLGLMVVAWRQGWPRWSASYYLYTFILLASPALYILQIQEADWAYQGMDILLGLVYILLLVGFVYGVVRRDALQGLLMLAPIAILSWWPVLEFIPGEIRNPLQLGMLVITTLVVVWIARAGDWRLGMWILLAGSLAVGLPISYFRTFFHDIPIVYSGPGNWLDFGGRYVQATFWSLLLVVGPMLLWALYQLEGERQGRKNYPLVVAAIFVNLGANLTVVRGYLMGWGRHYPVWEGLFGALILLSALAYAVGVIRILLVALEADLLAGRWVLTLLGIAAAGLPLMFLLPMFEVRHYTRSVLPMGLFFEFGVPDLWVFSLGVLWLVVGMGAITGLRLRRQAIVDLDKSPQALAEEFESL